MKPGTKLGVCMGAGLLVALMLLAVAGSLLNSVGDQPAVGDHASEAGLVGEQLWSQNNINMVILAVMLFAGILGVLALVGGEFRWH